MSVITGLVTFGNTIQDVLNTWADMGIFAYVLPFLLVFALVFGILWKSKILGDNRGVIVVIALTVGLLSLQFDQVPMFFATIFPYAGIGMAILLVALILIGLFARDPNEKWFTVTFVSIGGLIALIVILSALVENEWWGSGGWFWTLYWESIVWGLIIIGLLLLIIFASARSNTPTQSRGP